MFDRQSIHIGLLLWGCILSFLTATCMFLSKNFDKQKRSSLIHMEFACAILLMSDAIAWGYRGNPTRIGFYMARISNFCVFIFSDIILWLFHRYVGICLFEEKQKLSRTVKNIMKIGAGIATGAMLLVVISQFTGFYYYFDAHNYYHRNTGYIISLFLPMITMLIDMGLLIKYKENISTRMFLSMLSYIILPFIAAIILLFYYGISLINIAISISMILMFIVAVVEQNEHLARQEKEAADLKISIMMSQIALHFIYNTLTIAGELCETDPQEAKNTLYDFTQYLRGNINSLTEEKLIPFIKELEHTKYYLSIEKRRFGDKVNVIYDIKETEFTLPALTLQPIVENAVKHGIRRKRGGGTVKIKTRKQEREMIISVIDDGIGFDAGYIKREQQIGLMNVEHRIKTMCHGTLKIESIPQKGTRVEIVLPLEDR